MSLPPVSAPPSSAQPSSAQPSSTQQSLLPPGSEPDTAPTSIAKHQRSFMRAFVATNYLLGKRHSALAAGISFSDAQALSSLAEITDQLSHGVQEHRARVLAAEVGRLLRSLGAQKLK